MKEIGAYTFLECGDLKTVELHDGLKTIGSGAFSETSIEAIIIPGTITAMGHEIFSSCNNLKKVVLGEGIEECKDNYFNKPTLEDITIPSTVEKINNLTFKKIS